VSDERDRVTGVPLADDRGDGAPIAEHRLGAARPVRADGPHVQPAGQAGGPHVERRLQVRGQPQAFDRRARRAVRPAVPGNGHYGTRSVPVRRRPRRFGPGCGGGGGAARVCIHQQRRLFVPPSTGRGRGPALDKLVPLVPSTGRDDVGIGHRRIRRRQQKQTGQRDSYSAAGALLHGRRAVFTDA